MRIRLLCALVALCAISANAVTYLKADAPSEGQDGTGWATAFTTIEAAVANAMAKDGVVYAAQGVYHQTAVVTLSANLSIYGGFPGVSDAETPEDRDWDEYQTIFSGDPDDNDVWTHVEPSATPCAAPTCTVTEMPVLKDGRVNLPTSFSGRYDGYINTGDSESKNLNCPFVTNGKLINLNGVWFIGYGLQVGRPIIKQGTIVAGENRFDNCRFVGNKVGSGCIGGGLKDAKSFNYIENCLFFGNTAYSTTADGLAIVSSDYNLEVNDCLFISCMSPEVTTGGSVVNFGTADCYNMSINGCTFTRNYLYSTGCEAVAAGNGRDYVTLLVKGQTHIQLPLNDCTLTNNMTATADTWCVPVLSSVQGLRLNRSYFAGNRMETKIAAGKSCSMISVRRNASNNYPAFNADGALIESNTVVAVLSDSPGAGTAYASLLGNNEVGVAYFCVVNTVFRDNVIEAEESADVPVVRSRGLGLLSESSSYNVQAGFANCVFTGVADEGAFEVVQTGAAQKNLTIANTIFTGGAAAVAPFYLSDPTKLVLISCTGRNWTLPEGVSETSSTADDIPLDATAFVPQARLPGIRETVDIYLGTSAYGLCAYYYNTSTKKKVSLVSAWQSSASADAALIKDRVGTDRPSGSFTRGVMQGMSALAEDETAHALIVRTYPVGSGTTSLPATQMVAADGTSAPVTAIPAAGSGFDGWYDDKDTFITKDVTLPPQLLPDDDAIVVAKFATAAIELTFDLGEAGVFVENGEPTITVAVQAGEPVAVPAYDEGDAYHVYGWSPEVPALAPSADTTYTAQRVTKGLRTCTVAPGDNIQAAIDDMGIWRGEVHFTPGTYALAATLVPRANVRLVADGEGVLLTGDAAGDDYWKPNGTDPGEGNRTPVWADGVFNEPNPEGTDEFWQPEFGSGNCTYAIVQDASSVLTNFTLEGLTFTGFSKGVLSFTVQSDVTLRGCAFLANETAVLTYGRMTVEGGRFTGNENGGLKLYTDNSVAASATNFITGVEFSCNSALNANQYTLGVQGNTFVSNCVIRGNHIRSSTQGIVYLYNTVGGYALRFDDSLFEDNVVASGSGTHGLFFATGSSYFNRCRFLRNCAKDMTIPAGGYAAAVFAIRGGTSVFVADSLFRDNAASGSTDAATSFASILNNFENGRLVVCRFANTTFLNNTVTLSDASGEAVAGTFISGLGTSQLALINCSVAESFFVCDGVARYGEFATLTGGEWSPKVVNSAVWSEAADYLPTDGLADPELASATVKGIAGADPKFPAELKYTEGSSIGHLPVGGASDCARGGLPVYNTVKGIIVHYPARSESSPWWDPLTDTSYTDKQAADFGLTTASPLLPDAWAAGRRARSVAFGPLNVTRGLMIILR